MKAGGERQVGVPLNYDVCVIRRNCIPALFALMVASCSFAQRSAPVLPTAVSTFCSLRVEGNRIVNNNGNTVVLHGANLPTITEIEASGLSSDQILRELANGGASIARLTIRASEVTPTFMPAKVVPFVQQAMEMNLAVILSWQNDTTAKVDNQIDDAENFLRLAMTYLDKTRGVWFEPLRNPIDTNGMRRSAPDPRETQRAFAQRMIDVVRGFGGDHILVINHATWLRMEDVAFNKPFAEKNVVYGVSETLDGLDASRLPLFVVRLENASAMNKNVIGSASSGLDAARFANVWRSSVACPR